MSRRWRKACKNVIEISKQEGMNFSELVKFLRNLNNEMKAQQNEEGIKRTSEEKAFKEKADKFFELNECRGNTRIPFGRNNCNAKYAELLCVYFTYGKEIDSKRKLLMLTAQRFQIQTNTMRLYWRDLREILLEFFKNVPEIYKFEALELIDYTVKYIEDYF